MRVDPAVEDELLEREPPDLAPHRVEAGQQYGFGGVVDDEVDARGRLEGPDVASLPPDDPTLHLVRGQVEHADNPLGRLVARHTLDGVAHDRPGPHLRGRFRLVLDLADEQSGVALRLSLNGFHQLRTGGLSSESSDALQLAAVRLGRAGELRLTNDQCAFALIEFGLGPGDAAIALSEPFRVLGEQALPIVESSLAPFGLGGLLLRDCGQRLDLPLSGTAASRPDLLGVVVGLAVRAFQETVGLLAGGVENPPSLRAGGV